MSCRRRYSSIYFLESAPKGTWRGNLAHTGAGPRSEVRPPGATGSHTTSVVAAAEELARSFLTLLGNWSGISGRSAAAGGTVVTGQITEKILTSLSGSPTGPSRPVAATREVATRRWRSPSGTACGRRWAESTAKLTYSASSEGGCLGPHVCDDLFELHFASRRFASPRFLLARSPSSTTRPR